MHTWKDTAAITLECYVEYILNDQEYHELGTEVWLLIKIQDSWKMAWRAVVKNEAVSDMALT